MIRKTLNFTLKLEVTIDGVCPDDETLLDEAITKLDEMFPMLIMDSAELDCAVYSDYWLYTGEVEGEKP